MQRFFEDKKWLLLIAIVLAGSHARAQGTRDTLILNLDKALEIALSDNPTIKVAEEEFTIVCSFRLSRHVDDKDGYRVGSGEVAGFQTGFSEPGDQSLLSADAVAGLIRSFAEKL